MALVNPAAFVAVDTCFLRPTDRCFYCGDPLAGTYWIYWNGNDETGQQIWLHPHCAKRLADHFNSDWHKLNENP